MRAILPPVRGFWCVPLVLLLLPAVGPAQTSFSAPRDPAERDEERLEAALATRGSINFIETRLDEMAQILGRRFQVPIVLFEKKLEEAGISAATPVTKECQNLPLEAMLRHILDDLELTIALRNGVILITTPEDVESQLETRIYPVLDLVTRPASGSKIAARNADPDYTLLIEVIAATIQPQTWDEVGGPGSIAELDNAGALVVSQTRDIHKEIASLLIALRRAKEHQGIPSAAAPKSASLRASPRLAPPSARRYAPIPPQSWQLPQVYAEK